MAGIVEYKNALVQDEGYREEYNKKTVHQAV